MLNKIELESLFKSKQKFLILGIGGVSMSSIALILQKSGHTVTGYDSNEGTFTRLVSEKGIYVAFNEEDIDTENIACAVYTSAISEDSPLIKCLREKGIKCVVRALFLGELMKSYKSRIGVAGTHGKSTVSGMISSIFMEAKANPTIMIGAGLKGLDGGFRDGGNENYIFEACEYQDSFLSFSPTISVVLNAELDHTDYFKSLAQIKKSFTDFMNIASSFNGVSVVNYDNINARDAACASDSDIFFFSTENKDASLYADNITFNKGKASFDAFINGEKYVHIDLSLLGEFQISNALAAIGVSYLSGIEGEFVERALSNYTGVSRRFELRKTYNGAEIRDDYAHHPDEIRETISSVKNAGYKSIYVIYQPHTFTRTHDLFDEFTKAFDGCDEVIFADIYAAREKNLFSITSKDLADKTQNGKYVGDFNSISQYIKPKLQPNDLLIIMGAGDIINLEI